MHLEVAFIEGLGGPELILILVLCLLLFGGKRMPDLARAFGRSIREFKRAAAGVEDEIKRAIEEAPTTTPPPPAPSPPPATIPQNTPPAHDPHAKDPDKPTG